MSRKEWTDEEVKFLRDNFRKKDKKLAKEMNRNKLSVRHKRQRMGLYKQTKWREDEIEFLKENYLDMDPKKIAEKLGRTEEAVRERATRLDVAEKLLLEPWTEEEVDVLKSSWEKTDEKIAENLDRTMGAVRRKRQKLGLMKKGFRKWTEEEERVIKNNYKSKPDSQIGEMIDRSAGEVQAKRQQLDLLKGHKGKGLKNIKNEGILTERKAYLLGYLYGDGSVIYNDKSGCQTFRVVFSSQKEELELVKKFVKKVYGLEGRIRKNNYNSNHRIRGRKIKSNGLGHEYRINSKRMAEDLMEFGPTKSKKWRVPQEIQDATKEIKANFISGLFDSDGCCTRTSKNTVNVQVKQLNKKGLYDLKELLTDFNVLSNVWTKQLRVCQQFSVEKFYREIGFKIERKQKKLTALLDDRDLDYHKKIEKYKKIKRLYNKGLEISKISEKCDTHPTTTKDWLGLHNGPPRYIKQYENGINV